MMYQKPSSRWLMLKALCAIPVAVFAISAFATPATPLFVVNGKEVRIAENFESNILTDEVIVKAIGEENPEFPGGTPALMQYLAQSLRYSQIAQGNGIQGRVIVQFVVEKDGSCSDFHIVRNLASNTQGVLVTALVKEAKKKTEAEGLLKMSKALETEALRVLKGMPNWTPGKQRGRVVRVKYTLPVTFKLQ